VAKKHMNKKETLIDVEDALRIVLGETESFGLEDIDFKESLGRVLRENITSDREMPPFNRVSMDGIAIKTAVFESGRRDFRIENIQAAGSEQLVLTNEDHCIEAMTGAMLPGGTDAVIPYELISIEGNTAHVHLDKIQYFQNIHEKGLDRKQNDLLIPENTKISSAEIGVLATVGKSRVLVSALPKIAIVSTGDELVEVDQIPTPYQIRKSNVHTLYSLLKRFEIKPDLFHISDSKEALRKKIESLLETYDVLMFSGAVSKGKFDFLPEILNELGVVKHFHKVRQRPGKPFWFGKKDQTTIFAYPGNPVSTFVSCLKYFVPWLHKSLQLDFDNPNLAILGEDFLFKPELTYFLQVKIINKEGRLVAFPDAGNGSGDLANLAKNDGFLELPSDRTEFKKGEVFPLIQYRY
jgi:molybdopterin molybdotransferase